jgi:hypothetical protein
MVYIYGIYHDIYHLSFRYTPWYISKVVYTTFGVVYTMRQPSRCIGPPAPRPRALGRPPGRAGPLAARPDSEGGAGGPAAAGGRGQPEGPAVTVGTAAAIDTEARDRLRVRCIPAAAGRTSQREKTLST